MNKIEFILNEIGLDPKYLELEITEGVMINDSEGLLQELNRAKELGMKVSVDDFGTGYSSLSYLKHFPVDCLKIDKAFIQELGQDQDDETIIDAIISMANILGIKVVAEGAELDQQIDLLKDKGCETVQGFYFSKPLSVTEFENFMQSKQSEET